MNITWRLVQKLLAPWNGRELLRGTDEISFGQICLLSGEPPFQGEVDTLYVGNAGQMEAVPWMTGAHYAVCVGGAGEQLSCSALVLPETADLGHVLNVLLRYQKRLMEWQVNLEREIAQGESIQRLLDASEPLFTNPVFIMTRTLQLVACTRHIPLVHPDLVYTFQHRRFPEHMVQSLIENRWLHATESYDSIGFFYPPNYISCTQITKRFPPNPLRWNTLVMYGLNTEPDNSDLDLMSHLSGCCQRFLERAQSTPLASDQKDVLFLIDILEGKTDSDEIQSKSAMMQLGFSGSYRFYAVFFPDYVQSHAGYLLQSVQSILPNVLSFLYNNLIVLLDNWQGSQSKRQEYLLAQLEKCMPPSNSYFVVSGMFPNLMGLKDAFTQLGVAAGLGREMNPGHRVYRYAHYSFYHMLSRCAREVDASTLYYSKLDAVEAYDRKKNSDNLKLLELYLNSDRNVAAVAARMHLHRNSVVYRIHRIEEILERSLDDPEFRFELLVSFRVLHYIRSTTRSDGADALT